MFLHLNENQLEAYCDAQLSESEQQHVKAHLERCADCRARLQTRQAQMQRVRRRLADLEPGPQVSIPPAAAARVRLDTRLIQKEKEQNSMHTVFSRRWRPAWAALILAVAIGLVLAVPSVRAMAADFLSIFRVQQITVIPVDEQNLASHLQGSQSNIEKLLSDNVQYQAQGSAQGVQDAAEASQVAGFAVRLPVDAPAPLQALQVEAGANGTFTLDVARINQILQEMNRSDLALPDTLNQATVTVEVPRAVTASYGACATPTPEVTADPNGHAAPPERMPASDCMILIQVPSPTVTTPEGLNLRGLGEAFLELSGMPADQAQGLSERIDWSNTLVIPLPANASSYEDVQVDGVQGTLVKNTGHGDNAEFGLMWVKDGVVYAVSGRGDTSVAVQLADSLK